MKTVSIKLSKEDFEEFLENCNNNGQCMSEKLRELIKINSDAFENCTNCDEESHNTLRKLFKTLHDHDALSLLEDDDGRPLELEVSWNYD